MSVQLDETETRLREHFRALAEGKREVGLGHPVFALEHCLDRYETAALGAALGKALGAARSLDDRHQVCWVVHGAEQGYKFDGLEYWHSFASSVQHWSSYGDREQLRVLFTRFARTYDGAKPSGAWSHHYTNICWPVTNALLPQDLQVQLAHSLYNARHRLSSAYDMAPADAGRMVQRYADAPSSRFERFLQQHDLVGRIVQALLQGGDSDQAVLSAPTLRRIIEDLNGKRNAREWLHDAQRLYAAQRFRSTGLRTDFLTPPGPAALDADPEPPGDRVLLTPRLGLRRVDKNSWQATLFVPSFQGLVQRYPELRLHLELGDLSIACHNDGTSSARAVLAGQPRERRLRRWPFAHEVLLKFAPPNLQLDAIVDSECRLKPSNIWLFKRNDQGTASQVFGLNLLAGCRYIVVSRDLRLANLGSSIALDCEGVHAIALDLPEVVPEKLRLALHAVGLSVRRTVSLFPVGLLPRQWDDQGFGEWLTTETACFTIDRDHEFDSYRISVNGEEPQVVECGAEKSIYLQLAQLTAGHHSVSITTCSTHVSASGRSIKPLGEFELRMLVRPPSGWLPGTLSHQALVVHLHPESPTLDDLVEHRLSLSVHGDSARTASIRLVLRDASGETHEEHDLLRHRLPISQDLWSEGLKNFLARVGESQDFLSAAGGFIQVDSEDLGEYRIPLRHEPCPLRWVLKKKHRQLWLRLVNEGADEDLRVEHFDFASPTLSVPVILDSAFQGIDMALSSGLYIAHAPTGTHAVIACGREGGRGLDAWSVHLDSKKLQREDDHQLLLQFQAWSQARPAHSLARLKQRLVVKEIRRALYGRFCGEVWLRHEDALEQRADALSWARLEEAVRPFGPVNYAAGLAKKWRIAASGSVEGLRQHHLKLSLAFGIVPDNGVIQRAWSVAVDPASLLGTSALDSEGDPRDFAALVRGARLLHLCWSLDRPEGT